MSDPNGDGVWAEIGRLDRALETERSAVRILESAAKTWKERAKAAEARVERLENRHAEASVLIRIANDAATARKAERDEARAKLARADRLAEACRGIGVGNLNDVVQEIREALAAYEAGEPVAHPDTEREPSEVEMLRALDRSATRKRLDLESEIRELRKAEEWVRLIRMIARDYSGNMKLSKAIDRADAAFRSSSPQPTATHFACPQRHLDYEPQPEAGVTCPSEEADRLMRGWTKQEKRIIYDNLWHLYNGEPQPEAESGGETIAEYIDRMERNGLTPVFALVDGKMEPLAHWHGGLDEGSFWVPSSHHQKVRDSAREAESDG